jgi:hypothetical protein
MEEAYLFYDRIPKCMLLCGLSSATLMAQESEGYIPCTQYMWCKVGTHQKKQNEAR